MKPAHFGLTAVRALLLALAALTAVLGVWNLITLFQNQPPMLSIGLSLPGSDLELWSSPVVLRAISAFLTIVIAASLAWSAVMLSGFLASFQRQTFTTSNVRRLNRLTSMLSAWVLATIIMAFCARVFPLTSLVPSAEVSPVDGWGWLAQLAVLGAVPFILSVVRRGYERGVQLQKEQELTV